MSDNNSSTIYDEAWLRVLLVRSLREQGLRRACKGEPATYDDFSTRASVVFTLAMMFGVVFSLSDWLNASDLATLGIAVAVPLALVFVAWRSSPERAVVLIVPCWFLCLVVQIHATDHDAGATVGLPFVLTFIGVAVLRTRRLATLARSAPLVLPVTLSVLVIPLFTNDLWSAVHNLHPGNLLALAALSLLPLLIAVERRLRAEVDRAVQLAVENIDPVVARAQLDASLMGLLVDNERAGAAPELERLLDARWKPFATDAAAEALADPLRRRVGRAVGWVVVGLGSLATLYMGLMCWVLIPIANAQDWTKTNVPVQHVVALGVSFDVPLGPYLMVAVLLGLLAAAVLLASVAVDEDYARRMAEALLQRPAGEAIATLVPYLRIRAAQPPKQPEPSQTPAAQRAVG
jgi:hypothetical protein